MRSDWSKDHVLSEYKTEKACFNVFARLTSISYGRPNVSIFAKFHSLSLKLIRCR